MRIRRATAADLAALLQLERQCASAAHWRESQYQDLFRPGAAQRLALVVEAPPDPMSNIGGGSAPDVIAGFLIAHAVSNEWELENIAIAPSYRRKGAAKRLLDALFDQARQAGSDSLFLEVRESNADARKLYEKAGFAQARRRKSYYNDPPEDAILYRKALI